MNRVSLTKAIKSYARRHGHYQSTVRTCTVLRLAAIKEHKENNAAKQISCRKNQD